MKRLILTLLLMSVAVSASASGTAVTLLEQLISSTEIAAGVRWQAEQYRPLGAERAAFYVGGTLRIPLSDRANVFGSFERDFVDEPRWQTRAGVAFSPFSR